MREDWGLGWGARGVSWEGKREKLRRYFSLFPSHETPRGPQPNPQSSLIPKKHLNSDWVRVWGRAIWGQSKVLLFFWKWECRKEKKGENFLSSCLSEVHTKRYKQNSCIKSRFSVTESMFDDVRYEPINFVISRKGVSKRFRLKKILKNLILLLLVMCSFS